MTRQSLRFLIDEGGGVSLQPSVSVGGLREPRLETTVKSEAQSNSPRGVKHDVPSLDVIPIAMDSAELCSLVWRAAQSKITLLPDQLQPGRAW